MFKTFEKFELYTFEKFELSVHRCEQKRHGSDESSGSVESRWIRTAKKAEGGNEEIGKRVSETEANPSTHHTTSSQMSIPVWPHAVWRWASCQSMDHRGRRQLRVVDRYLRRVCTGEWLECVDFLPFVFRFEFFHFTCCYKLGVNFANGNCNIVANKLDNVCQIS